MVFEWLWNGIASRSRKKKQGPDINLEKGQDKSAPNSNMRRFRSKASTSETKTNNQFDRPCSHQDNRPWKPDKLPKYSESQIHYGAGNSQNPSAHSTKNAVLHPRTYSKLTEVHESSKQKNDPNLTMGLNYPRNKLDQRCKIATNSPMIHSQYGKNKKPELYVQTSNNSISRPTNFKSSMIDCESGRNTQKNKFETIYSQEPVKYYQIANEIDNSEKTVKTNKEEYNTKHGIQNISSFEADFKSNKDFHEADTNLESGKFPEETSNNKSNHTSKIQVPKISSQITEQINHPNNQAIFYSHHNPEKQKKTNGTSTENNSSNVLSKSSTDISEILITKEVVRRSSIPKYTNSYSSLSSKRGINDITYECFNTSEQGMEPNRRTVYKKHFNQNKEQFGIRNDDQELQNKPTTYCSNIEGNDKVVPTDLACSDLVTKCNIVPTDQKLIADDSKADSGSQIITNHAHYNSMHSADDKKREKPNISQGSWQTENRVTKVDKTENSGCGSGSRLIMKEPTRPNIISGISTDTFAKLYYEIMSLGQEASQYREMIVRHYLQQPNFQMYKYFEESLMRLQLKLDKFEVDHIEPLRLQRKEVTKFIIRVLDMLDQNPPNRPVGR